MPEYSKMKNADLEALLKTRGLPTGGKKADMVDRLTKDDETKGAGATDAPPAKSATLDAEDEIDWDDDVEEAPATKSVPAATSTSSDAKPSATTAKAGGTGAVGNPQAVPNQVADIDPSTTADLTVKAPGEKQEEGSDEPKAAETKEPTPDYSRGLAATNLDEEIEKRKKRALKFGLKIDEDEELKKLERAKKFGETGPPKGLDEALPERPRKRGRDDNEDGGRNKRRGGGRQVGRRGRGGRDDRDNRRDDRDYRRDDRGSRPDDRTRSNGGSSWMSEADRAKAEARKAKFAKPAAT